VAFKIEGHRMYGEMLTEIREAVTQKLLWVRLTTEAEQQLSSRWRGAEVNAPMDFGTGVTAGDVGGAIPTSSAADGDGPLPGSTGPVAPIRRKEPKVGRNDPCPCGSGKKYKKCHGRAG
jgi:preprotein translocase subunit SecA